MIQDDTNIRQGDEPIIFGQRLSEWRRRRKLTQEELARKSGVSRTMIARYETAVAHNPNFETIDNLAKALDCRVSDLTDEPSLLRIAGEYHPPSPDCFDADAFWETVMEFETNIENSSLVMMLAAKKAGVTENHDDTISSWRTRAPDPPFEFVRAMANSMNWDWREFYPMPEPKGRLLPKIPIRPANADATSLQRMAPMPPSKAKHIRGAKQHLKQAIQLAARAQEDSLELDDVVGRLKLAQVALAKMQRAVLAAQDELDKLMEG